MRDLDIIIRDLQELCMCELNDSYEQCLYCDAREHLLAQQRTIRLIQVHVPKRGSHTSSAESK